MSKLRDIIDQYKAEISSGDELTSTIELKLESRFKDLMLELVGQDEQMATKEFGMDPKEIFMPSDLIRTDRNNLREELRAKIKAL